MSTASYPDRRSAAPTVAVVLAAGAGSRFAGDDHKLAADLDGEPVATHAIRAALAAGIGPVVVVTGAHTPSLAAFATELADGRLATVHNPRWADGQATSLQVAIAEAERRRAHAIVVGLADQPFITSAAWSAVAASNSPIAVASYDIGPRNPVRLHRSVWPLLPSDGDEGARAVVRLRPQLVEPVPCEGSPADIDTLEDLRTWQNRSSTNSP